MWKTVEVLRMPSSMTAPSPIKRANAAKTVKKVMDLFSPLHPTTYTLHLDFDAGRDGGKAKSGWEKRASQSLTELFDLTGDLSGLSVETLDYPIDYLEELSCRFDLNICMDAGHHLKYGHNLTATFEKYEKKIPIIHLHGVDFSSDLAKDHTSLDKTPEQEIEIIVHLLDRFSGVVSLEVFNLENLICSLNILSNFYQDIPRIKKD